MRIPLSLPVPLTSLSSGRGVVGCRVLARVVLPLALVIADIAGARAAGAAAPPTRADIAASIEKGVTWLLSNQNSNGWWSTADQPAVTGVVLTSLNREPTGRFLRKRPSELNRAYDFVLGSVRPDGSIHRGALANYNTSLCLLALSTADDPHFLPVIRNARAFLASTQIDFGEPGKQDTPFDGGVGYGSRYQHSDMANTLVALEAMRWSERVLPKDLGATDPANKDLNWAAVANFLQNCQNLPGRNTNAWVSEDPKDRGGFVYYPGESKAGGTTNLATGKVALRSYGSISYAGLLSYIYAKVGKEDPRVAAVLEWLRGNFTLEENPGLGPEGYYYYLHLMTKALTAAGVDRFTLADGREVEWRNEVAARLIALQQSEGFWSNKNERWWEADRNLVTGYALLTLEMLHAAQTKG